MKITKKKGFTLIELIVVMAVIGILVLLAMPKFMGYTEKARLTEMKNNIKQLENASERYYINKQDWPRLSDTPYTWEEIDSFAQEVKNRTGATVTLDKDGSYYSLDYKKLQKYVQEPKDGIRYILQNPVGEVFYLDGLTPLGESKLSDIPSDNTPTGPSIKTSIADMKVGDLIVAKYVASSGKAGVISDVGTAKGDELPLAGTSSPNGTFYFVKVADGLLIADRVVQTNISWNELNNGGFMYDNRVPVMTSSTSSGTASTNQYLAGFEAWKAFDGNTNLGWDSLAPASYPVQLEYEFKSPIAINSYSLYARNDGYYGQTPKNWTFEAWDGSKWVVLDTRSDEIFSMGQGKTFNFNNATNYSKYRINVTANNGATGSSGSVHIAELKMLSNTYIRSLSGGVSFADTNGQSSLIDKNNGNYPMNNEWDTYIVNSDLNGTITPGDDSVWHWSGARSWTQNTPITGVTNEDGVKAVDSYRIYRGMATKNYSNFAHFEYFTSPDVGFRPVMVYTN